MIVNVDDDIIADNISKIFYIKKQLRVLNKKYDKNMSTVLKRTIGSLEKELQKSRSRFSEEIETKIEELI